jgi:replication factor C small subunit
MFVEKYRPRTFDDVIGLHESIKVATGSGEIPHFLFSGSPGTGKTTIAHIIINMLGCEVLMLNASDENGINIMRGKVKNFASTKSTDGKIKIIFLDEADALTPEAQFALRNLMEKYYQNCRFILTCNFVNKILEALQSRCQHFKFEKPALNDIVKRLKFIVKEEHVKIVDEEIRTLAELYFPDIRKSIHKLESLHNEGKIITADMINKDQLLVHDLFTKLKNDKLTPIRQWVLDNNVDYDQLLVEMSTYIWKNKKLFGNKCVPILIHIGKSNRNINSVVSKDIEFTDLLLNIVTTLNK